MARICAKQDGLPILSARSNQNRMDARCFGFRDAFRNPAVHIFKGVGRALPVIVFFPHDISLCSVINDGALAH